MRLIITLITVILFLACKEKEDLIGSWSYCEEGHYYEVHFYDDGIHYACPDLLDYDCSKFLYSINDKELVIKSDDFVKRYTLDKKSEDEFLLCADENDSSQCFSIIRIQENIDLPAPPYAVKGNKDKKNLEIYIDSFNSRRKKSNCPQVKVPFSIMEQTDTVIQEIRGSSKQ
jgi:hypothetical protein